MRFNFIWHFPDCYIPQSDIIITIFIFTPPWQIHSSSTLKQACHVRPCQKEIQIFLERKWKNRVTKKK